MAIKSVYLFVVFVFVLPFGLFALDSDRWIWDY